MTAFPPQSVLDRFGTAGVPVPLSGGQGQSVAAGALVLKPVLDAEECEWLGTVLSAMPESPEFRLARPVRSRDWHFVEEGFQAFEWVAGTASPRGRWEEVLKTARAFHAALKNVAPHPLLARRQHRWAFADRVSFGEAAIAPSSEAIRPLAETLAPWGVPTTDPPTLIHGDLSGNLLFADGLPPAVIDVSPYYRPEIFAQAIIVVDAWLWHGEEEALASCLRGPNPRGYLARALLFRLAALNEHGRENPAVLEELPLFERVVGWVT